MKSELAEALSSSVTRLGPVDYSRGQVHVVESGNLVILLSLVEEARKGCGRRKKMKVHW